MPRGRRSIRGAHTGCRERPGRSRASRAAHWFARGPAAAGLLLGWWSAAGPAGADVVRLKNGNVLEGTITQRDERQVTIDLPDVGALVVDRADVASIEDVEEKPSVGETAPRPVPPVSQDELVLFERPERMVRLWYPKDWHVQERLDRHPYAVTITPKPFDPTARDFTVIELRKYYHASRTMGLKGRTGEELMEQSITKFRGQGAQILESRNVQVQGVPARRVEARAAGPKTVSRLLLVTAVKDDTLISLYCQAPAHEFEARRRFFEAAAERAEAFTTDPTQSDNARIDAESTRLTQQALEALERGDEASGISRLQEALRVNPGDLPTRASYGSLLVDLALQKREPQRGAFLGRAEAELNQTAEWLEVLADPQQAPALAQAYFLLGEVAARGRNQPEKARPLYEKALRLYPAHDGAKRALGR